MFTDTEPVLSGAAVADRLGVARSTAYRYLQSLVATRFLEEAPEGGFRLGLRILEIARVARRSYGLSEAAMPIMTGLCEATGETILLTRRVGDLVVCVERAESRTRAARISYEPGSTLAVNAGASALALLAWSPPEQARAVLESAAPFRQFTPATLTDVDDLMKRLVTIRADGYSITRAELDPDVLGIAAPIRNSADDVVAAVSVAALATRVDTSAEAKFIELVLDAARAISERIAAIND